MLVFLFPRIISLIPVTLPISTHQFLHYYLRYKSSLQNSVISRDLCEEKHKSWALQWRNGNTICVFQNCITIGTLVFKFIQGIYNYTPWNKPCFYGIQRCSCSVFTICSTCNVIIIIEFFTSQLWLGNIHISWDVVINRIRLCGLIFSLKSFLHLNMCQELQIFAVVYMYWGAS